MKKILIILGCFIALQSQAQLTLNSDIVVAAQRSVDGKQYNLVSGKHVPYTNAAQFLSIITSTRRHVGEIAYIMSGSRIQTWQFVGGIADSNFVSVAYPSYLQYPLKALNDSTAGMYGDSVQIYTSGSAVTASLKTDVLVINPASAISSLSITFPDSASYKNTFDIIFGGTIVYGSAVITSITFVPGSGQSILMPSTPGPINSGTVLKFKFVASLNNWYLQ